MKTNMTRNLSKNITGAKVDEHDFLLFDISSSDSNNTVVSKVNMEYTQNADGCSPVDCPNTIEFSTEADGYYVIKTDRWAFDDPEELYALAKDFCKRFTNTCWEDIVKRNLESNDGK